jgi:hypothetical protein
LSSSFSSSFSASQSDLNPAVPDKPQGILERSSNIRQLAAMAGVVSTSAFSLSPPSSVLSLSREKNQKEEEQS